MSQQEMQRMVSESAVVPPEPVADDHSPEVIDTRFGEVTIYRKDPVVFPNGLLGMPDKFEYCLTKLPSDKLARFKLLQSLDDLELSFITLPLEVNNPIIEQDDIAVACKDLDIRMENLTLLLIVTVHRLPTGIKLSVNARAPVCVNTPRRVANQYVFHNNKYDIQHMITL